MNALAAVVDELQQMLNKRVFRGVRTNDLSGDQRKKIIRSSIFLKVSEGEIHKRRKI